MDANSSPSTLSRKIAPVHVGFGEAVGLRIELCCVLLRLEPERVELGVEMAAHAVGADQHQRVDRIARRLLHVARGELDAGRLRLLLDLVADAPLGLGPLAVERGDQIAVRPHRPVRLFPGRALRALGDVGAIVLQRLEEVPPGGVDRGRVVLDIGRRGLRCRRRCRRRGRRFGRRLRLASWRAIVGGSLRLQCALAGGGPLPTGCAVLTLFRTTVSLRKT